MRGANRRDAQLCPKRLEQGHLAHSLGVSSVILRSLWCGFAQEFMAADRPDADPMVGQPVIGLHDQVRYDINVVVRAGRRRVQGHPPEQAARTASFRDRSNLEAVRMATCCMRPTLPTRSGEGFVKRIACPPAPETASLARWHRGRSPRFQDCEDNLPPAAGNQTAPGIG
jgi:hypothetical protein